MAARHPRICRTPEECFEAGRRHAREMGWRLSDEQITKFAALLGPYLRAGGDRARADGAA